MADVVSRRSIVYDILFDVEQGKKSAKEAQEAIEGIGESASGLEDMIKGIGKGIVAAFAVDKILAFAAQASALADKAAAIRVAFEKLNNVSLEKLRAATGGAVDDIVLMQKAVQAANFKIPLQELEKLFRFATIRAKETGESVDGLIDSVVEGLAGGSARAFKALGISANEFQRKMSQTGNATKAVVSIIDESFRKTGDSLEGLVDSGDKLNASFTNFSIAIGGMINEGFLDDFKDSLSDILQFTTDLITGQDSYNTELEETRGIIKKMTEEDVVKMISSFEVLLEVQKQQADQGRILSEVEIQAITDAANARAQALINSTKLTEEETDKQIDAFANLKKSMKFTDADVNLEEILETEKSIGLVGDLQRKLSQLSEAIPTAKTKEQLDLIRLQIAVVRQELDKLLNPELTGTTKDPPQIEAQELENDLIKANIDLRQEQIAAAQQLFEVGASLLDQNSSLGRAFFFIIKGNCDSGYNN